MKGSFQHVEPNPLSLALLSLVRPLRSIALSSDVAWGMSILLQLITVDSNWRGSYCLIVPLLLPHQVHLILVLLAGPPTFCTTSLAQQSAKAGNCRVVLLFLFSEKSPNVCICTALFCRHNFETTSAATFTSAWYGVPARTVAFCLVMSKSVLLVLL